MDEHTHKWARLSESEWNALFARLHQQLVDQKAEEFAAKGLQLSKGAFGKAKPLSKILQSETLPNDFIDWLKIITYIDQYYGIYFAKKENRRCLFNIPEMISPPEVHLGKQGKHYIQQLRSKFVHMGFGPPLTQGAFDQIKQMLNSLDEDLTQNPKWEAFWEKSANKVLALTEPHRQSGNGSTIHATGKTQKILEIKEDILTGYRNYVIAHAFNAHVNHSHHADNVDLNYQMYLQTVYTCLSEHSDALFFAKVIQHFKSLLSDQLKAIISDSKSKIASGVPLVDVSAQMSTAMDALRKDITYTTLGSEEAEKLLVPLMELKNDYLEIADKINAYLNAIAGQFVPCFDQSAQKRLIFLIKQAADAIQKHPAFIRRSEVGKHVLARHLTSKQAIRQVHEAALKARIQHFKPMLQNQLNKLLTHEQEGLPWIVSPRARREVIEKLFQCYLQDILDSKAVSPWLRLLGIKLNQAHHDVLSRLQEAYLNTYAQDAEMATSAEAGILLKKMEADPLLKPLPKFQWLQKDASIDLKQKIAGVYDLLNIAMQKNPESSSFTAPLFSEFSTPEADVTMGLFNVLQTDLNHTELFDVDADKVLSESILDETSDNHAVLEQWIKTQDYEKIQSMITHESDPLLRIMRADHVFEILQQTRESRTRLLKYVKRHPFSKADHEMIYFLQNVKIRALVEAWHARAREAAHMNGWIGLPDSLARQDKNRICVDLIFPAKKSPLLNCDISNGRAQRLQKYLAYMVEVLNALPEHSN